MTKKSILTNTKYWPIIDFRVQFVFKNPSQHFDIVDEGVEFDASKADKVAHQGDHETFPESDDLHKPDDHAESILDDEVPNNRLEQGLLFEENKSNIEIVAMPVMKKNI